MIQVLSINRALTAGEREYNGIECRVVESDSALHAFNQIIHLKPDVIVLNMDPKGMDTANVVKRIKKMQAAERTIILLLSEYTEDVEQYIDDSRTFSMLDDEMEETVLDWIFKKLGARPKSKCQKILVVDDDEAVLDQVELYLGAKYDVTKVKSASIAFSVLEMEVPDLILLDIAMPGMDGKATIKKLKSTPRLSKVPVIFETGMAGFNTVKECMQLGAMGFVVKPVQKSKLLDKVAEALDHSNRKSLLLIDEYDFHYQMVTNLLQGIADVDKAPATLMAVSIIEEKRPDYILLNADNAMYLLNKIREKSTALQVPIILTSGGAQLGAIAAEVKKPHTYSIKSPLTREALVELFNTIGEWT